jgi:hypothetical protein
MLSGKSTHSGEILRVGDIADAVREFNSFRRILTVWDIADAVREINSFR